MTMRTMPLCNCPVCRAARDHAAAAAQHLLQRERAVEAGVEEWRRIHPLLEASEESVRAIVAAALDAYEEVE